MDKKQEAPKKEVNKAPEYDLRALFDAGCHFGHRRRKWHPKMAPYIYTEKDGIHIFDLEKTATQLQKAYNYAYKLGKQGKNLLFVGTKRQAREVVSEAAKSANAMYITSRWLGGFLTNWQQIRRSLNKMNNIEDGLATGKYDGHTKYERVQLEKQKSRLERFFIGVKKIKDKPDCLFVIDPNHEKKVVIEARKMGVPVIALIDTNANPEDVDLVIPANDDAVNSVKLIANEIAKAYLQGKQEAKKK